jgi:hypothetical protein
MQGATTTNSGISIEDILFWSFLSSFFEIVFHIPPFVYNNKKKKDKD